MKRILLLALLPFVAGCGPRHETAKTSEGPRIVSFLPSGTETLFALGLGDSVVGRSRFCDFPAEAAALPVVGDLFSANEDVLAALKPTHAVLGRADAPQAALLRALGCEIVEGRAETAEDVLAFADTLGALFPERTNGLANAGTRWRDEMEKLSHAEFAESAERVLVVVSHAPGRFGAAFAAGEGTYFDELLRAAGFSNALAGVRGYPSLDPDRIAALAPDVLVDVHPETTVPAGTAAATGMETVATEAEEDAWGYLPDVRIEILRDTAALRPGPRLPEVLERFRALGR
ncbi:MAG: ABC transporter substrate-binding protein [Kiritimatiellae bacterium]|nr:ABC transporter substrate-binding protein [Kiritimatiellia bacterium]